MATTRQVILPDIGDFKGVDVIEVAVSPGDRIAVDEPLITLESDKATMDVPSTYAGTVSEVHVKVGDKVSEGDPVVSMEVDEAAHQAAPAEAARGEPGEREQPAAAQAAPQEAQARQPAREEAPAIQPPAEPAGPAPEAQRFEEEPTHRPPPVEPPPVVDETAFRKAHASPSVRRFARELGVDLSRVQGSGPKGRILKEDVQAFVKEAMQRPTPAQARGFGLPELPEVDFSAFGEVEVAELPRIKKLSGPNLHRNWLTIPHVTQHDEADITELEDFRKSLKAEAENKGVRLTLLAFLVKAVVYALKEFPELNASLDKDGEHLVLKKYFHIGFAVDTPGGLVVPVLRDADRKGLFDIARELGELSQKARDKKLSPADMQGGCFTVSSLGGIGGTAFTPIINWPEVAILGVSRARMQPVWNGEGFDPRLMLPLSLSYDHRVIDGATGARFTAFLGGLLGDIRRVLL